MIQIQKFVFSPFFVNTYFIRDDKTTETIVVDPGCSNIEEEEIIEDFITTNKLIPRYLINTHCHIDHIFGCAFIKKKYNPIYFIPEADLPLLKNAAKQAEMFGVEIQELPHPEGYLSEDLILRIGKSEINFIFTPGHTPGEFCLYLKKEKILISGDVLFKDSIGRTDLWGGDHETLISSIRNKLFKLPPDTNVYPGHGENTTLFDEEKSNPFL